MFDEMPAQKRAKEDDGVAGIGDRVGALPDALLHHVLSFLPAEEAVRTCVLARRWRHLWKSAPGLNIGFLPDDVYEPVSVAELRTFVDSLLLLRAGSPLDAFELRIGDFSEGEDEERMNLWFRHAVACKARVVTLYIEPNNNYADPRLLVDNLPLVSMHLSRLQLNCVWCHTRFLDFSSCPALEHLEFDYCNFSVATRISSESLKSLSITGSHFSDQFRLRICAPNLTSLHLDDYFSMTPILECMPSLVEAYVGMTSYCSDWCSKLNVGRQDCNCEYCDIGNTCNDGCVLLKGLSQTKKLTLFSKRQMFIFKKDLRWCPTFSKLKVLLLNDYWCVHDDQRALACILEHSPVLEKLTLHLLSKGPDHKMEMKGSFSSMDRSIGILEHLKLVEIKCETVNERVFKVLKFLCTFNICFSC